MGPNNVERWWDNMISICLLGIRADMQFQADSASDRSILVGELRAPLNLKSWKLCFSRLGFGAPGNW